MRLSTSTLVVVCTGLVSCTVPAAESTGGLSDSRIHLESGNGRRTKHFSSFSSSRQNDVNDRNQLDHLKFYRPEEPKLQPTQSTTGDSHSRLDKRAQAGRHTMSEGNEQLGGNMSKTIEEAIAHAKLSHKASLNRGSTVQYVKAVRVADNMRSEIEKRRKPKMLSARVPRRNGGRDDETHRFVKSLIYDHLTEDKLLKGEFLAMQEGWRNKRFEPQYESDTNLQSFSSQFKNLPERFEPLPYRQNRKYYDDSPNKETRTRFPWHPREISESANRHWWEVSPTARSSEKPLPVNHAPGHIVPVTTFRPTIRSLDLALYTNRKKNLEDRTRAMGENRESYIRELHEEMDVQGGRVHKQLPDDYRKELKTQSLSPDNPDNPYRLKSAVSPTPVYFPKSYREKLNALDQMQPSTTIGNPQKPVWEPLSDGLEESHNSVEKDIIPDKEPIFQDVGTHPVEIQYYSALEDEIRKSAFLTESVRLVSSDSFRDLVKSNKTTKKSKKKNKESTKLDNLIKSGNKYSSTRKRKTRNRQKLGIRINKQKNDISSLKSAAETNDSLYNETQKWQDYYRSLRMNSKFRNDEDQHNQVKTSDVYPTSRNPSVSKGYYQNWNTVPRSFQNEPQQYHNQNLRLIPEENESFTEFEESNEINSNQNGGPRFQNGNRKPVKDYYATKNSKLPDASQIQKDDADYYSSTFLKYPKGSEKYDERGNNSAAALEYHNSHLFSEFPYGYEEKIYNVPETVKTSELPNNVGHAEDEGTTHDGTKSYANLQGSAKNQRKHPLDYASYRPLKDDYYDYYKMYDDYTDQYYDYGSNYYDEIPAKNKRYWDYSYPVEGLLSGLHLPRMYKTGTAEKNSYKPHLNVPSIDEQYNFKLATKKLDVAYQSEFPPTRNKKRPRTTLAPIENDENSTFLPITDEPQITVTLHSEQQRNNDENDGRAIEHESNLDKIESISHETDHREANAVTSNKPLLIPDASTESKLISSVLAQSSILRSMSSSATPQFTSSDTPRSTKPPNKSSVSDSVRRSPIPRLLWKGREIPRHPVSPKLKPEDISYGWYPIPSPFSQATAASTKKNAVIFPSMPFTDV